jgi:hypothetical protein
MSKTQIKRRIEAIERYMADREDVGGLLDELLELEADLRELEK